MKTINLTDNQYKHLVKMAFIGEWILNAQNVKPEYTEETESLKHLFSQCGKFGLTSSFHRSTQGWELNNEQVLKILPDIEKYSNFEFWEELIDKLAKRDLEEIQHQFELKDELKYWRNALNFTLKSLRKIEPTT